MKKNLSLLFFVTLLFVLFLSWMYVFNIYEVDITYPDFVNVNETAHITLTPLNSFGKKAPFRKIDYDFNVLGGSDLIKKIEDKESGVICISAADKTGKIKIVVKSNKALAPSLIEIPVKNIGEI